MKKIVQFLMILTLVFACKNTNNEQDYKEINSKLTADLEKGYQKGAIVGFSVSIVDSEGVLYENSFGYRDTELSKKYTPNTLQNIASISKTLIGVSLLKAQELGKLNLEDPINQYLPFDIKNPAYPDAPILIKHLAYHTSSIVDIDEVYARSYVLEGSHHDESEHVYEWFQQHETKIELIEFLKNSLTENGKWYVKEMFANTKPGEVREYSNIGAALCAQIIQNATGQDYQSFTKEYILKPLKMNSSGWTSKDIDASQRSKLFINKETTIANYSLITYADGGFISSNQDLNLYLIELINGYHGKGTLLNKESYQKLFEWKTFPNAEEEGKFGIFMEFTNEFIRVKEQVIGHNGSDPGVTTAMYYNPETKTGKIMFINTDSDAGKDYWPEVVSIWKSLIAYESSIHKERLQE